MAESMQTTNNVNDYSNNGERMRQLNSIMNAVLNNMPIYLFMKDSGNDFRYVYFNETFLSLSHFTVEEAVGKNDFELFPDSVDAERYLEADHRTLAEGRLEFIEEYTSTTGETRVAKTIKSVVPSGTEHPFILGISWDITDLKQTEKELIEARIRAEESDRLKSAFLANMSHEIRTPLNAIVGFSSLIGITTNPNEQQQYGALIEENSNILLSLVNDVLDISVLETGTLELHDGEFRLSDVLKRLHQKFSEQTQDGVQLILDSTDESQCMQCDEKRFMQVMTNQLRNAVKFTTTGEIHFGYIKNDHQMEFYVKDTGIGIALEHQKAIFNRFDKENNFVQGAGLGLTISRLLVAKMGGEIGVTSAPGEGATFYFTQIGRASSRERVLRLV